MTALVKHVSVRDDLGVIHTFGPDSGEIPDWAVRKITNPAAWEDSEAPFPPKPSKPEAGVSTGVATSEVSTQELEDRIVSRVLDGVGELLRDLVAVVEEDPADEPIVGSGPPPKAGRGSGEDKWRAYAAEQGVDVAAIEDRNEIIAALAEAGVPVE